MTAIEALADHLSTLGDYGVENTLSSFEKDDEDGQESASYIFSRFGKSVELGFDYDPDEDELFIRGDGVRTKIDCFSDRDLYIHLAELFV